MLSSPANRLGPGTWNPRAPPAPTMHQHSTPAPLTRQAEPRPVQVAHGWDRDLPRAGRPGLGTAPRLGGHHHLVDRPIVEASGHTVDLGQLRGGGWAGMRGSEPAPSAPRAPSAGLQTPGPRPWRRSPRVHLHACTRMALCSHPCMQPLLALGLGSRVLGCRTPLRQGGPSEQPLLTTTPALTAPPPRFRGPSRAPPPAWRRPWVSLKTAQGQRHLPAAAATDEAARGAAETPCVLVPPACVALGTRVQTRDGGRPCGVTTGCWLRSRGPA